MAKKNPEQIIQIGVFSNLTPLMYHQKYSEFIAFQIRNETGVGGEKGAKIGAFAKAMGTMEGVSDTVFLFPPRNPFNGKADHFIPNKVVFVEFKALKPLKTKDRDPESLLSDAQDRFKFRVEMLGFEYRIIAATDVNDAISQCYSLLRENGVAI